MQGLGREREISCQRHGIRVLHLFMQPQPPGPDAADADDAAAADDAETAQAVGELARCAVRLALDAARAAMRHLDAKEAAEAAGLPPPAGPDPAEAFCRMSSQVCRLVALKARLAAGQADVERERKRARRIEPRRMRLRAILQEALVVAPDGPDREALLRTVDAALEDAEIVEMMADGALVGDMVIAVCHGFDLRVDDDRLPDEALRSTRPFHFPYRSSRLPPAAGQPGPDPP
jgi:hypothetical protein